MSLLDLDIYCETIRKLGTHAKKTYLWNMEKWPTPCSALKTMCFLHAFFLLQAKDETKYKTSQDYSIASSMRNTQTIHFLIIYSQDMNRQEINQTCESISRIALVYYWVLHCESNFLRFLFNPLIFDVSSCIIIVYPKYLVIINSYFHHLRSYHTP